jgi:CRISPR-associated protein Cmr6
MIIPSFSETSFKRVKGNQSEFFNPGLFFYRFFYQIGKKEKETVLREIKKTRAPLIWKVLSERRRVEIEALENLDYSVGVCSLKTDSRLACGLGIPSLVENGLLMDRVFGIPYLPGSVLKGIAQDAALMEMGVLDDQDQRRKAKRQHPELIAVFGTQSAEYKEVLDRYWEARKGHVRFLDAFPVFNVNEEVFDLDIVNPHYGEYYGSKGAKAPADYLSPDPNFFLTVKAGLRFEFTVAARDANYQFRDSTNQLKTVNIKAKDLVDKAWQWLKAGLTELGVGGKTRVGYGLFK